MKQSVALHFKCCNIPFWGHLICSFLGLALECDVGKFSAKYLRFCFSEWLFQALLRADFMVEHFAGHTCMWEVILLRSPQL